MNRYNLMFYPEGPKIEFEDEIGGTFLRVFDLNPEKEIRFRLDPHQLLIFGFRCIFRSIWRA